MAFSVSNVSYGREMVIASQPLAAQAGLDMLARGGNAADAAIAAAAVLAVVEPTNNGVGGDAFALVWDGERVQGVNGSGRAPARAQIEQYRTKYGTRMPTEGWDSVTVPGAVSAWVELSRRMGKLSFRTLLEPAIRYARYGFHVTPLVATKWKEELIRLKDSQDFIKVFTINGRAPGSGELFTQPALAETLLRIADSDGQDFYHGTTCAMLADYAAAHHANLTREDVNRHQAEWLPHARIPMMSFADARVYELPPNGQGIIALYALGLLRELEVDKHTAESTDAYHLQIECIKKAFADVGPLIADPERMTCSCEDILHPDRLSSAAAEISPFGAGDYDQRVPPLHGTVYLAAGDQNGMMVSFVQSNYMGFGSGVVVPDLGFALQNRGAGFSLDESSQCRLQGGDLPFHTILPGFYTDGCGNPTVFGSTGGIFQPQGHVQIVVRLEVFGQNPQEVINSPRFKVGRGRKVVVEPGFNADVLAELAARGHDIQVSTRGVNDWGYGGMQILRRQDDLYIGGKDFRRDSHIALR